MTKSTPRRDVEEAEKVAASLTEAQRKAVKREAALSIKVARTVLSDLRLYGTFTHWTGHHWYPLSNPTPLGLAVREIIIKGTDNAE